MIKEAIILAGGLGTRLKNVIENKPKCLAPVNGRPFYHYLIDYLKSQSVSSFVFSLGYEHTQIENDLKKNYPALDYTVSVEKTPLGTGGAIGLALKKVKNENVLVCNGDTIFKAKVRDLYSFHLKKLSVCSVALKEMMNFERYGAVQLSPNGRIDGFEEKKFYEEGLINGGMYILNKDFFTAQKCPKKFSFETDFLETQVKSGADIFGKKEKGYFIDIGIPEDYEKAQTDFQNFERL